MNNPGQTAGVESYLGLTHPLLCLVHIHFGSGICCFFLKLLTIH